MGETHASQNILSLFHSNNPSKDLKEFNAAIQREEITYFCRCCLHSSTRGVKLRSGAFNYILVEPSRINKSKKSLQINYTEQNELRNCDAQIIFLSSFISVSFKLD